MSVDVVDLDEAVCKDEVETHRKRELDLDHIRLNLHTQASKRVRQTRNDGHLKSLEKEL